ncbi:MAG: hypothetical protein ACJ8DJ_11710, partial [Gemmatimonadales bacterium]
SAKARDGRPANRPADAEPPPESAPPPVENAQAHGLITGLAEALKEFEHTRPAPAAEDDAAALQSRPRLSRGGWR